MDKEKLKIELLKLIHKNRGAITLQNILHQLSEDLYSSNDELIKILDELVAETYLNKEESKSRPRDNKYLLDNKAYDFFQPKVFEINLYSRKTDIIAKQREINLNPYLSSTDKKGYLNHLANILISKKHVLISKGMFLVALFGIIITSIGIVVSSQITKGQLVIMQDEFKIEKRPYIGLADYEFNQTISTTTMDIFITLPIKNYGNLPAYFEISEDDPIFNLQPFQYNKNYLMPTQSLNLQWIGKPPQKISDEQFCKKIMEPKVFLIKYGTTQNRLIYKTKIKSERIEYSSSQDELGSIRYKVRGCGIADKMEAVVWVVEQLD